MGKDGRKNVENEWDGTGLGRKGKKSIAEVVIESFRMIWESKRIKLMGKVKGGDNMKGK